MPTFFLLFVSPVKKHTRVNREHTTRRSLDFLWRLPSVMGGAAVGACVAHGIGRGTRVGTHCGTSGPHGEVRQCKCPRLLNDPRRSFRVRPTQVAKPGSPRRVYNVQVASTSQSQPTPAWWDVRSRLDRYLESDSRSENGYLEHDSEPVVKFRKDSKYNGTVSVIAQGPWRSLRFNEVEQGLSYVLESANGNIEADCDVLGYEYLRCMTAAAMTMCCLDGDNDWRMVKQSETNLPPRIICVGLGSGAMPAFIARKFPHVLVDVVEIDPIVVEAVSAAHGLHVPIRNNAMGVSHDWFGNTQDCKPTGLGVVVGDAGEFMKQAAEAVRNKTANQASVIFLDAFDGDGKTPAHLTSADFLKNCHDALAPGGVVVSNSFNGVERSFVRCNAEWFAVALNNAIGPVTSWNVETPVNVVFAARKINNLEENNNTSTDTSNGRYSRKQLKAAAKTMSSELDFEWCAGTRVKSAFFVEMDLESVMAGGNKLIKETPAGLDWNPLSKLAERFGTAMPREWAEENEDQQEENL